MLTTALLLSALATGQEVAPPPRPRPDLGREPLVPPQSLAAVAPPPPAPPTPTNRVRLLGIQPGFLNEQPSEEESGADLDAGPNFVTFAVGNDNPFFDFRQRGDPGGVGYARVNTQVQLFGTETTAFSLGVRAVAPAGLEYDGLPDRMGATVLSPALSVFHSLDDTTALQAFVTKNMPIQNGAAGGVNRDVQCGMAVQRPFSTFIDDPLRHLYLSVGAVGQYRLDGAARVPMVLEVFPGLHYKANENWWISGAMSMPVGSQVPAQAWQVTCSMQF